MEKNNEKMRNSLKLTKNTKIWIIKTRSRHSRFGGETAEFLKIFVDSNGSYLFDFDMN